MVPSESVLPAASLRPAPAPAARGPSDAAALQAEHDALAERLAARASILEIRRASVAFFFGLLLLGLTGKLGWDRWGTHPAGQPGPALQHGPALQVWLAMLLATIAFALSIRWFLLARALLAEEAALFARFKELRAALGYDP